ncbi:endonuclease VII domain-containing protein [Nocardia sp. IFM 10818]
MPPSKKRCKDCEAEGVTTRRPANYPGPRCASHHRQRRAATRETAHGRHLETTYGITKAEYQAILAHQGGKCAICQRATGARRRLAVDHSHADGTVRGALCKPCNRNVLGHLRDDPAAFRRAIDYLTHPPAYRVIGRRVAPIHEGT